MEVAFQCLLYMISNISSAIADQSKDWQLPSDVYNVSTHYDIDLDVENRIKQPDI